MTSKSKKTTIHDVAEACGVSPATVSLVINNSPRPISVSTRERVLRYVRESRYTPNAPFRKSDTKRLTTLGVLAGHGGERFLHYSYFLQVLGGIMDFGQKNQLNLLILNEQLWESTVGELRLHVDGRCDGLILIGAQAPSKLLPALQERGIPFVVVGNLLEADTVPYVDVDNREGAKQVVRHLIEQGPPAHRYDSRHSSRAIRQRPFSWLL